MSCNWARPTQGLPGPAGPRTPEESEKSPERVPRDRAPKVPKECAPESQKSPKRVQKSSFETLCGLFWAPGRTLSDFWGPVLGYSFGTLFGLLRGSRARRARRPSVGRGQLQIMYAIISARMVCVLRRKVRLPWRAFGFLHCYYSLFLHCNMQPWSTAARQRKWQNCTLPTILQAGRREQQTKLFVAEDGRFDSRESIRANHAQLKPYFCSVKPIRTNHSNFRFVRITPPRPGLRPLLDPPNPPIKFMWSPFLRPFPEMRHISFFSGGLNWVFWGGAKSFYVEINYMLFSVPICTP